MNILRNKLQKVFALNEAILHCVSKQFTLFIFVITRWNVGRFYRAAWNADAV